MFRSLIVCLFISASYAQFGNQRIGEDRLDMPAWYQVPSKQMTPPFAYERREPQFERMERPTLHNTKPFVGYPSFVNSRHPFTESIPHSSVSLTGSVPPRRYPSGHDMPYESSISRYHKLLLRKQTLTSTQYTTTIPPIPHKKKPMSLQKIYSIITPKFSQHTLTPRVTSTEKLNNQIPLKKVIVEKSKKYLQIANMSTTSTSTITIIPTKNSTSASVFSKIFPSSTAKYKQISEEYQGKEKKRTFPPFGTRTIIWNSNGVNNMTSTTQRTPTTVKPTSVLDYIWPNTELLAAIKDVVAKFKASLDETGIDQDVRQMGNQLRNTWQQLKTGPMNGQIGRLFEKVADDSERHQINQHLANSQNSI